MTAFPKLMPDRELVEARDRLKATVGRLATTSDTMMSDRIRRSYELALGELQAEVEHRQRMEERA